MGFEQPRLRCGLNFVDSEYGPVTALCEHNEEPPGSIRQKSFLIGSYQIILLVWIYLTAILVDWTV
jgi:hypothetical protein